MFLNRFKKLIYKSHIFFNSTCGNPGQENKTPYGNLLTFFFLITGVQITIDSKAQLTLLGTEMDYIEDRLSSQFVFNNPNIKGTCGCGESFNIWICYCFVLQSQSVRGVPIGKFELIPFRRVASYAFILNTKILFLKQTRTVI